MKKDDKKSIFPEKMPVFSEEKMADILGEVENLSARMNTDNRHALSKNNDLERTNLKKNDISYLVKSGYDLPEVKSAKQVLKEKRRMKKRAQEEGTVNRKSAYRMVNLVSDSYNLPEIDDDNLLK